MTDYSAMTHERLKVEALYDYWAFIELIKLSGGVATFGDCHKELVQFLVQPNNHEYDDATLTDGCRKRLVLMPREHLKSTLCSIGYVLWRVYRNPDLRIAVSTNVKELSQGFVRELKTWLEDDELQVKVWNSRPHIEGRLIPVLDKATRARRQEIRESEETEAADKKIVWTTTKLQVNRSIKAKEPTIMAFSVGTKLTGWHFDLLILDDIVDWDNSSSPQLLERTRKWAADLRNVVIKKSRVVTLTKKVKPRTILAKRGVLREIVGDEYLVLGTRYHLADYYGWLEKNAEDLGYVCHIRNVYKNGLDGSDGYLWHEHFNLAMEKAIRVQLTEAEWASQYLNRIISEEDVVFKSEDFQWLMPFDVNYDPLINLVRIKVGGIEKLVRPVLCVDPAFTLKRSSDFSAIGVGGMDDEKNLYLIDIFVGKVKPATLIGKIYHYADKWHLSTIHIETGGQQETLIYSIQDQFKTRRSLVIKKLTAKGDKKTRIADTLQPLLSNHKLFMMSWMKTNTELMDEFMFFPQAHDDALDVIEKVKQVCTPTVKRKPSKRKFNVNRKYGGMR